MHAFLDGATPVEILRRLMVLLEGTLGFVAEAVLEHYGLAGKKRPWHGCHSDTIDGAVEQVGKSFQLGAQAVELMVAPALTAAAKVWKGSGTQYWKNLDPKNAALLVEFGFDSDQEMRWS